MERTQRQLGTRLADRLGGDHADHFAFLNHASGRQVASVTLGAYALARLARQHRTDIHRFHMRCVDRLGDRFGNLFSGSHDQLAGMRIVDVVHGRTAQDTFVQRLYDILVALDRRSGQAAQRTAVLFADNHVLRHIDQTARQITGIGRFQRGIGQTLTGAVRRDEIFQHRKPLLEVRQDRVFDDLTSFGPGFLRLGHQTAHPGELADLLLRTAGPGIQHHVHRIETLHVLGQVIQHRLGQLHIDIRPDVDNLVVTFIVGDKPHVVALHHLFDALVTFVDQRFLFIGNDHRIEVERQSAAEGHLVSHVLDIVEESCRFVGSGLLHHQADDVAQRTFGQHFVQEAHLFGNHLVEDDPADGRIDQFTNRLPVLVEDALLEPHLAIRRPLLSLWRAGRRVFHCRRSAPPRDRRTEALRPAIRRALW